MAFGCLKELAWAPLPIETNRLTLSLVWHERYDNDPAHHWFREKIMETVQAIIKAKQI